ncbi:MAG: 3-hydroxyacyl-ACP dehydratase FabZ [Geminicoccaceae bacterium]
MQSAAETVGPIELGIEQIKNRIPHRYPFLMIDRMVDVVLGESAVGIKNVTINEPFFQGHFPDQPIMPGVLVIEAMAQTAGTLVAETYDLNAETSAVFFMAIEQAKFRHPIYPGDQLRIPVRQLRSKLSVYKYEGKAYVGDKLVAEATYSAKMISV